MLVRLLCIACPPSLRTINSFCAKSSIPRKTEILIHWFACFIQNVSALILWLILLAQTDRKTAPELLVLKRAEEPIFGGSHLHLDPAFFAKCSNTKVVLRRYRSSSAPGLNWSNFHL